MPRRPFVLSLLLLCFGTFTHCLSLRTHRNTPRTAMTPALEVANGGQPLEMMPAGGDAPVKQPLLPPWRELVAEALGTFIIVQLGTGSVMSAIFTNALTGLFQIASIWIIAVTMAIVITGPVSGAHLNPAVSIVFALFRGFEWRKVLPYSGAQLVGAVLASALNFGLYANHIREFEAANGLLRATALDSAKAFGEYFVSPLNTFQAFCTEAFGTGALAAVIFAVTHPSQKNPPIPPPIMIGMTVGGLIGVLAPLTQGGFNPARDFGPRIVAYLAGWTKIAFRDCWVYIVAPVVGAVLGAALIDKVLYSDMEEEEKTEAAEE